jgi:hypothetical protein
LSLPIRSILSCFHKSLFYVGVDAMMPTVRLSIRLLRLLIAVGVLLWSDRVLADQTILTINHSWKIHVKVTPPPSQQGGWQVHLFRTPTDITFADGEKRSFVILFRSNNGINQIVYREGKFSNPPLVSNVALEFDATLQRDAKQITFTVGTHSQMIDVPATSFVAVETGAIPTDTGAAEVVLSPGDAGPEGSSIPTAGTSLAASSLDKKLAAIQTSVDNSQSAILFRTLLLWLITLLAVIGGALCLWILQRKAQKRLMSVHVEQKTIADGYDKRLSKMDNTLNAIATQHHQADMPPEITYNELQETLHRFMQTITNNLGSEMQRQLNAIAGDLKQMKADDNKADGTNSSLVALLTNLSQRQKQIEEALKKLTAGIETASDKLQPVQQEIQQAPAFQAALKQVAEQVALKAVEEAIDLVLAEKLKTVLPAALLAALQNTEVQRALKRDTPRTPEANSLQQDGHGQATDGNAASADPPATRTPITNNVESRQEEGRQPSMDGDGPPTRLTTTTSPADVAKQPMLDAPQEPDRSRDDTRSLPAVAPSSVNANHWRQELKKLLGQVGEMENAGSAELFQILQQIQECYKCLHQEWKSLYGPTIDPRQWDLRTIRVLDFALYYQPDLHRLTVTDERHRLQPLCEVLRQAQRERRQELAERGVERIEGIEFVKGELESSKVSERTTDKSLIGKVARIDPGDGGYLYRGFVLKKTLAVFYAYDGTGA